MKLAFENTPEGSPLRALMLEELSTYLECDAPGNFDFSRLNIFEGTGILGELVRTMVRMERHGYYSSSDRVEDKEKCYMFIVGNGPKGYMLDYMADVVCGWLDDSQ